jgi:choline monooxygenase
MKIDEHKLRSFPLEQASALDARFYTDPEVLELDRRVVISRSWQLAAHAGELKGVGDHVVCEVAGKPILIVRDEAGELRGFFNVCRHRAGPFAKCSGRGAQNLTCWYHGWTYGLDGHLRSAPEMSEAEDFDVEDIRLAGIQVAEWCGLVFVALSVAVPLLGEVYDGIVERIQPIDLTTMSFARRVSYELGCNWKVYIDNYLEGYHLPYVHPGLSMVLDYRSYATELKRWSSLQHSPLVDADEIYGEGNAWYFFVYPNTMLNVMPGRMQTNRVVPLAVDRCRIDFDYYYSGDGVSRIARDLEFSDEIQQEDIAICEAVQKGLASGSYSAGRLSPKRESGVWHFHNLLREAYRES